MKPGLVWVTWAAPSQAGIRAKVALDSLSQLFERYGQDKIKMSVKVMFLYVLCNSYLSWN